MCTLAFDTTDEKVIAKYLQMQLSGLVQDDLLPSHIIPFRSDPGVHNLPKVLWVPSRLEFSTVPVKF